MKLIGLSLVFFLLTVIGCTSNRELGFELDSNGSGVSGCLRLHNDGLYYRKVQVGMTYFYSYGLYKQENDELILMPLRTNRLFVSEMKMSSGLSKMIINTNLGQAGLSVSFYENGIELMGAGYYDIGRTYDIPSQKVDSITVTTGLGATYGARISGENYYYSFFLDYYSHGNFFFDSDTVRLTHLEKKSWIDEKSGELWTEEKGSSCLK